MTWHEIEVTHFSSRLALTSHEGSIPRCTTSHVDDTNIPISLLLYDFPLDYPFVGATSMGYRWMSRVTLDGCEYARLLSDEQGAKASSVTLDSSPFVLCFVSDGSRPTTRNGDPDPDPPTPLLCRSDRKHQRPLPQASTPPRILNRSRKFGRAYHIDSTRPAPLDFPLRFLLTAFSCQPSPSNSSFLLRPSYNTSCPGLFQDLDR